jgi:hypothetical protein
MALLKLTEWIEAAKVKPDEMEELDVEFESTVFARGSADFCHCTDQFSAAQAELLVTG